MTPTVKKLLLAVFGLGALGGLLLVVIFGTVLVRGPHMVHQPHLRAFEAEVPLPPPDSVPVTSAAADLPAAGRGMTNPLPATAENIDRGRVYYGYYCLACHGASGDGHGPVGQSYMPVPADLRGKHVQQFEDGRLVRAMLLGVGHEPVLPEVVPPQHRWYLALYIRSLPGPD